MVLPPWFPVKIFPSKPIQWSTYQQIVKKQWKNPPGRVTFGSADDRVLKILMMGWYDPKFQSFPQNCELGGGLYPLVTLW